MPRKKTTSKLIEKFTSNELTILGALIFIIIALSFFAGFLLGKLTSKGIGNSAYRNETTPSPANQPVGEKTSLSQIIKQLGMDEKKFQKCLDSQKYADKVNSQLNEGANAGIRGTPGGVIFDVKTGKTKFLRGAVPYEELMSMVEALKRGESDKEAPSVKAPNNKTDHWRGPKNARFVLIEYSDFQCPFCDRFHPTAKDFITKNKNTAWVYRHFPLRSIHPYAQKLAEASECVWEQKGDDGFWAFADKVFEAMPNFTLE